MDIPADIDPLERCRRCEHPFGAHDDRGACTVEFSPSAVPSTQLGGNCSCAAFVYEPTPEPSAPESEELLDGPRMYDLGLAALRVARRSANEAARSGMLERAVAYFTGAQAAALAQVVIDNDTGGLTERRWAAALAGDGELPEPAPQEVAQA
jgi:hypothetical protein